MIWGPWITKGMPSLGEYIRVMGQLSTGRIIIDEGIVVSISDTIIRLAPDVDYGEEPYAIAFRRRIVPDKEEEIERARELEDA